MKTQEDLLAAVAGESQANRKYAAFADVAEKEGHKRIARLFRAASEAESIHATAELKLAGKIGDTKANLGGAIEGETYEFTTMYPDFQKDAKNEGQDAAFLVFERAKEAEKVHAALYKDALDNINSGEDAEYYLCPVCGYIEKGRAPDSCPICKSKGSSFKKY
jgi:rubrerythrin